MSFARIKVEAKAPVAWIKLANPPQNVIDIQMMEELGAALADLEPKSEISVIVFTGGDKHFSSGVDIAAHAPDKVRVMLTKFHAVIRALVTTRKVTLADVRGNCLGGGAELAMMCDLVYTARSARWQFPEITLACFPPVAVVALAAIVGQKRAADLILSGRAITGDEAGEIGLANKAVPDDEVEGAVLAGVKHLTELSAAALEVTKKALYVWDSIHFDKGLARAETIYLAELMETADAKEGVHAWMEKRRPVWKGK